MTIREEIKETISKYTSFYPHPHTNDDTIVDSIISEFEKRIDSVKELEDKHNYSGDGEFIDGFSLGFDFALQKLEEMLK